MFEVEYAVLRALCQMHVPGYHLSKTLSFNKVQTAFALSAEPEK